MNYYRRYLGDYMRDTMHLSMLEHGAYTVLLDAYYATEKPLPASYEALNRMCRAMTTPERKAVKSVADQFFPVRGDMRHNPRADKEIAKASELIEKQKANGLLGGRPKGTDSKPKNNPHLSEEVTQTITQNNQPPSSILHPLTTNPQPPEKTGKSGADAPAVPEISDPCAKVFSEGVALLTACGEPERGARGLLGKLRRDYGDEAVLEVIERAKAGAVSDAKAFLVGALRPKGARLAL